MNPFHLLSVLRARWLVVLGVAAVVFAVAANIAWQQPKHYAATAALMLESRADPVSSMLYGGGPSPALLNTQIEIMRSDRVMQRVVKEFKLDTDPDLNGLWMRSTSERQPKEDWLVAWVRKGMDVVVQPGSNVVTVTYKGRTGQEAAGIANGLVRAYVQTAVDLRVEPAKQYNAFFGQQLKESREALERSQAALAQFQRDNGILITEGKDLDTQRLEQLTKDAADAPAGGGGGSVQNNPAVVAARGELSRAEGKVAELSRRFGDNHPQVQEARAVAADLRNQLASETQRAQGQVAARARDSQGRSAQMNAAIEQQRLKLLKLQAVRDQAKVLARDVDSAQKAYDAVLGGYNQTTLESQNRQSNATIISEASVPPWPSSPRLLTSLAMAAVGALLAGMAVALAWERLDRRVRTVEDLSASMGLPVIGIMPSPIAGRTTQRRLALTQKWMISGRQLPAPANK